MKLLGSCSDLDDAALRATHPTLPCSRLGPPTTAYRRSSNVQYACASAGAGRSVLGIGAGVLELTFWALTTACAGNEQHHEKSRRRRDHLSERWIQAGIKMKKKTRATEHLSDVERRNTLKKDALVRGRPRVLFYVYPFASWACSVHRSWRVENHPLILQESRSLGRRSVALTLTWPMGDWPLREWLALHLRGCYLPARQQPMCCSLAMASGYCATHQSSPEVKQKSEHAAPRINKE